MLYNADMKKYFIIALTLLGIALLAALFFFRVSLKEAAQELLKPPLPEPKAASEFVEAEELLQFQTGQGNSGRKTQTAPSQTPSPAANNQPEKPVKLAASINLDIPFGSQAPFGNWELPYQESCEEAAIIMAHRYLIGETLTPKIMDEEILKLIEWERKKFGFYEDTTAEEIARTLREYFNHDRVEVRYEFTIDDIKREIALGHPVIVPAAGRLLPNPNFRYPGPIYHALVVKGYTDTKIITNDPGTRNGHNFLYDPAALMNAIHDWNPKNILDGRPAIIVVYPPKI